jgi:glycosyltransferase involved in cell wall biosynthesis
VRPTANTPTPKRPARVVMFVRNDSARDVRVLREAKTLSDAGYEVVVVALQTKKDNLADREVRDGFTILRVLAPTQWRDTWQTVRFRPWEAQGVFGHTIKALVRDGVRGRIAALSLLILGLASVPFVLARRLQWRYRRLRPTFHRVDDTLDWLVRWRWSILAWAWRAARAGGPADVYHAHDLNALGAAVAACDLHGGRLVYDSHELYLEAGATAKQPWWARAPLAYLEWSWSRRADAIVTVNESIGRELQRRYRHSARTVIVRNCPPKWTLPGVRPNLLREAAGIPLSSPVVLYHGGFVADRGIEQLADVILLPTLGDVHAVFMGFGPLLKDLEMRASDGTYGGRLHVLAAVDPSVLLDWVASADVSAVLNQPTNLNQLFSTPNKLFESIAAGTPVVSADTPDRRAIVLGDGGPFGELCDPVDPGSIARGIRRILDLPTEEAARLRRRCYEAGQRRYNWEHESATLLDLYSDLMA